MLLSIVRNLTRISSFCECPMRGLHVSSVLNKEHRKNKRQNVLPKRDFLPQERSFDVEPAWLRKCEFPDENTSDRLFNGVRFADIPITHIKVSRNNTIYCLSDPNGKTITLRSCGMEGFKKCRKGTNIAAQATAIAFSQRIKRKGVSQVRVCIRGLGPGRMASIKGLDMGGLNIVSITDKTRVSEHYPRPRKQRRL